MADLLWKYYIQQGRTYEAAKCQYDLSKADFPLNLDQRIEYLSRAKANASSYSAGPGRSGRQKLLRFISDFLDAASIQCDILQRLKSDERIAPDRREDVLSKIDGPIMLLDEVSPQEVLCHPYTNSIVALHTIRRQRRILRYLHNDLPSSRLPKAHGHQKYMAKPVRQCSRGCGEDQGDEAV